ncbi:L-lactate MFS transporter [Clostridium grantii]|uniref:MFS transporter, OFA family, oxalate/formate antiporter n=1 Tax=Clostridium grantii DSM 8605 TaxID=1121316 RepID=A0A1M5VDZ0_9CLOT|nr:OFA family MFS transporter [Clostridium grantii]SHH73401.1 MFS transporter, OFA family, oxalate/formate antiporter [Clostridium grantii DSM 8605]
MTDKKINRNTSLFASTIINLCVGAVYAFSVFAGPLAAHFNWTRSQVMTAFTISTAISAISMILGGKLVDKGGARIAIMLGSAMFGIGFILTSFVRTPLGLYLSYGVVTGLGQSMAYSGNLGNIIKLFPDKKGLASGIVTAGYGGGTILAAPIINYLIQSQGVLATFRFMGIAYFLITVSLSMFVKPAPAGYKGVKDKSSISTNDITEDVTENVTDVHWTSMIKKPKFYLIVAMLMIGALSGMMITSNASTIGQSMFGLSATKAAFYVSLYALSNCLGRVFWGTISDKLGRYKALICIYSIIAIMLLFIANTTSILGFACSLIGIGLCFGGTMGVFPSVVAEKFGMKYHGVNYGITFIGYSAAAFFGPKIAVQVADSNKGDFTLAFYIALVLSLGGIFLTLLFMSLEKKNINEKNKIYL